MFYTCEIEGPLLTRLVEPGYHLALDEVIPFNLRSGAIDGALKRVASWLDASAGDAVADKQSRFEQLERMGARPSKSHNWDEAFRDYAR